MESPLHIEDADFCFFAGFLKSASGYHLSSDKKYLLESRLFDVLRAHKIPDIKKIILELKNAPCSPLAKAVVEAMTVNETYFFRDRVPFDDIRDVILPDFAPHMAQRPLKVWSAACSTGQEPYSIAMLLEESTAKYPSLRYDILATDINTCVLDRARKGAFSDVEIGRGLDPAFRDRYFTPSPAGCGWMATERIKKNIRFSPFNLLGDFAGVGVFDIILLRNVLIYFDRPTKDKIIRNICKHMHAGTVLFLGAAESLHDHQDLLRKCPRIKCGFRLA